MNKAEYDAMASRDRYAERVAMEIGMGIVEVIAILVAIWPLIQKMPCFERKKAKLLAAIENEHRECCRHNSRCPYRLRKAIETRGASPRLFWHAMSKVAFAHHEEVASMMMKL